jgi:tRNA/rRNA methyltransferase
MANFGFAHLILSDALTYDFRPAEKLALKGEAVLEQLRLERSLSDAVAGSVYALGTTSREVSGRAALTPEAGAQRLVEKARGGRVSLVLGGEKRGLSDADLAVCQEVVRIPTHSTQPSMNLAQAAAVLMYVCAHADNTASESPAQATEPAAPLGLVRSMQEHMQRALLDAGFLNPQAPEHILNELVRSLLRGGPSAREVALWKAAFEKLARRA